MGGKTSKSFFGKYLNNNKKKVSGQRKCQKLLKKNFFFFFLVLVHHPSILVDKKFTPKQYKTINIWYLCLKKSKTSQFYQKPFCVTWKWNGRTCVFDKLFTKNKCIEYA